MKNTLLIALTLVAAGCGSSAPTTDEVNNPPTENLPPENNPENVGVEQPATPGTDPIQNRTYTNTYGNNFCDNGVSDLQCWGDIDFHAGTAVQKLYMGRDAICYALSGYGIGNMNVDCYSATLGPIVMNAHQVSGRQNSSTQTFMNVTVNTLGQMCFKVAEWQGSSIHAIYNECGYAPTSNGGIQ